MSPSLSVLQRVFGYPSFRPPQDEIIDTVLAGRDCFVLMPTGAGKSLCYQIPALVKEGTTIVVSPLISLMQDQVDALVQNGVRAAFYNSSLSGADVQKIMGSLRNGDLDLLYVSPERMMRPDFQNELEKIKLAAIAVDEAHCVSQWGHDFRPEYVQLGEVRDRFSSVPFIALTATADQQTRNDILLRLRLKDPAVFVSGFDRPNIRYTVVDKSHPSQQLEAFVKARPDESGIVYCLSRKRVEEVADRLREVGFRAAAYHAGMNAADRSRVQKEFQKDDIQIVVATVAFGMGIDKPNVRFVVHFDLPWNVESYYQETGRAGRDGLPSEALMMYGRGDIPIIRQLINTGENPEQNKIQLTKLNSIIEFAETLVCRRSRLLAYFGETRLGRCENCDICLNPPGQFDATQDAKLLLMTVYRLKQKFGMTHVVDMVRGTSTERTQRFGHEELEGFGAGSGKSRDHWSGLLRQLIQLGYLIQDDEHFGVLKLTPLTKPLLRDGETLTLAAPRTRIEKKKKRSSRDSGDVDDPLFQKLRSLRKKLADEQGVPPYIVFGDQTLKGMASARPQSEEEMLAVSGVGEKKMERYGAAFLEALREG